MHRIKGNTLFFISFIFFKSLLVMGQSNGEALFAKAEGFLQSQNGDSAVHYFALAKEQFLLEKNLKMHAEAIFQELSAYQALSKFNKVELLAADLLAIEDTLGGALDNYHSMALKQLGMVFELRDGNYLKALAYYHRALQKLSAYKSQEHKINLIQDIGIVHLMQGNVDSTDHYFSRLLAFRKELYEQTKKEQDGIELANIYRLIGTRHTLYAQSEKAQREYKKAVDLLSQFDDTPLVKSTKANLYSNLGATYGNDGLLDSALYYYHQQKAALDGGSKELGLAGLFVDLTNTYIRKRNYDSSLYYGQKALEIMGDLLSPEHPDFAYLYINLGDISIMAEESLENAKDYYQRAFEIRENALGKNHFLTVEALRRQATFFNYKGQLDEGIAYQKEAIARLENTTSQQLNSFLLALAELGEMQQDLGLYELSINTFQKVLDDATEHHASNPEITVNVLIEKAESHLALAENDKAHDYLSQAEKNLKASFAEDHHLMIELLRVRAWKGLKEEEFTKSLVDIDKALELIETRNTSTGTKHYAIKEYRLYLYIASLKAEILLREYAAHSDIEKLKSSIEQSEELTDFIKNTLPQQSNLEDRLFLSKIWQGIYQNLFTSLTKLINHEPTFEHKEKLFTLYEESKSLSLLLRQAEVAQYASDQLPEALFTREKEVKVELSYYTEILAQEMMNGRDSSKLAQYAREKLIGLRPAFSALKSKLQQEHNEYYELYYNLESIAIDELQNWLDPAQVIVEYVNTSDKWVALLITKDDLSVIELPYTSDLAEQVIAFGDPELSQTELNRLGQQLYEWLMAPLASQLDGKEEIFIIPQAEIWNVNFDLLLTQNPGTDNVKDWPFLIKEYALGYANSSTLLASDPNPYHKPDRNLLAYSYNQKGIDASGQTVRNKLAKLPGTARELETLEEILNGDYHYGQSSSESNFKKNSADYKILHLALHGSLNHENPNHSSLLFSNSEEEEDGSLHIFELYNLQLGAELAVLSACDTGSGSIVNGEGILSLGRAFKYAGVNSLLLSRTQISDHVTPEIMASFYNHLKEGKSKTQALRLAKLEFLETSDNIFSNPHYWSNFFILGNGQPIKFEKPYLLRYSSWFILGFAIAILLAVRQRFRNSGSQA